MAGKSSMPTENSLSPHAQTPHALAGLLLMAAQS
jgi:hypothetical protein